MAKQQRSIFARLKSADPDAGDSRHGLACRYVALPDRARSLVNRFLPPAQEYVESHELSKQWRGTIHTALAELGTPILHALFKDESGRSSKPVGFVDVILPYRIEIRRVGESNQFDIAERKSSGWQRDPVEEPYTLSRKLIIEVKTTPVSASEILREVKLIQTFVKADHWLVATLFDVTADDIKELSAAGLPHFRLGPKYEAWAEDQSRKPADLSSPEV